MKFISKKTLENSIEYLRAECRMNRDDYWKLYHKYEALLNHLELKEVEEPKKLTFVKKSS